MLALLGVDMRATGQSMLSRAELSEPLAVRDRSHCPEPAGDRRLREATCPRGRLGIQVATREVA